MRMTTTHLLARHSHTALLTRIGDSAAVLATAVCHRPIILCCSHLLSVAVCASACPRRCYRHWSVKFCCSELLLVASALLVLVAAAMVNIRQATVNDLFEMQNANLFCLPENYQMKSVHAVHSRLLPPRTAATAADWQFLRGCRSDTTCTTSCRGLSCYTWRRTTTRRSSATCWPRCQTCAHTADVDEGASV